MVGVRHIDAGLGDDFHAGLDPSVQRECRSDQFLDTIPSVDLGGINGGDIAVQADFQQSEQAGWGSGGGIVKKPPGAKGEG